MKILLLLLPLLLACAAEREPGELFGPSEADLVVVDAILIVDQPMPDIFLRRTLSPNGNYSAAAAAIADAQLTIHSNEQSYTYTADPDSAGRYLPPASAPAIAAQQTYLLEASLSDGRTLTASTTTPQRLVIEKLLLLNEDNLEVERELKLFAEVGDGVYSAPENEVVYRQGLVEAVLADELDVAAYQLAIFNLEDDSPLLIDADFLEQDDLDEFEREGASPALSVREGRARLPLFAIAFAGRHKFKIYALDKNWFDFIRTDPDSDGGGFGGLLGDQFQRPIFNVTGGIGFFASASVYSIGFSVRAAQ